MIQPIRKLALPALLAGLLLAAPAPAAEEEGGRRRRGPPAEAFTACEGLEEGASCTVITRRGDEMIGECASRRDEFFCVPEGGPPRGHRREGFED